MQASRFLSLPCLAGLALSLGLAGTACRPADPEREPGRGSGQAATAAAPSPVPSPSMPAPSPSPAPAAPSAPMASAPAGLPADRPLRAGFLAVNGVYNSELMAPYDVFQHTVYHVKPGIEVFTVSPDGQPITTSEGLRIAPQYSFANAPAIDILVVPSGEGSMEADLRNPALIDWVRRTAQTARHVISLCDGAFVLAQAGLLDGVAATTFPDDYQRLAQTYPRVDLRVNVSFVDTGKILTSEGGARSYDVAMHLVDQLYGPQVAAAIGKGLVIPWPPDPDTTPPRIVEHAPAAAASPVPSPAATPAGP